jgi:hypothetical protein
VLQSVQRIESSEQLAGLLAELRAASGPVAWSMQPVREGRASSAGKGSRAGARKKSAAGRLAAAGGPTHAVVCCCWHAPQGPAAAAAGQGPPSLRAALVPLDHEGLPAAAVWEQLLLPLLRDPTPACTHLWHDTKQLHKRLLAEAGQQLPALLALPLADPLLASYLLNPEQAHGPEQLAQRLAGTDPEALEGLVARQLAGEAWAGERGEAARQAVREAVALQLSQPPLMARLEQVRPALLLLTVRHWAC